MVNRLSKGLGLLLVLTIIVLAAGSCVENQTGQLPPVEIREFQGQKLSSVNDFRENSIKGPQFVDIKDYKLSVTGLVKNPKEYTYAEGPEVIPGAANERNPMPARAAPLTSGIRGPRRS